jgi:hypothetical protein
MPRPTRPSKFASTATPAQSSGGGGGWQDISFKHSFQEGTPNEGSPLITGFQDTTPGWRRFLAGLGGLQGVDVNAMNMQLALSQQAQERASQEAIALERLRQQGQLAMQNAERDARLAELEKKFGYDKELGVINRLAGARIAEQTEMTRGEQERLTSKLKAENEKAAHLQRLAEKLGVSVDDLSRLSEVQVQNALASLEAETAKSGKATLLDRISTSALSSPENKEAIRLGEVGKAIAPFVDAQGKMRVNLGKGETMFGLPLSGVPSLKSFRATGVSERQTGNPLAPTETVPGRVDFDESTAVRDQLYGQGRGMLRPADVSPESAAPVVKSTAITQPQTSTPFLSSSGLLPAASRAALSYIGGPAVEGLQAIGGGIKDLFIAPPAGSPEETALWNERAKRSIKAQNLGKINSTAMPTDSTPSNPIDALLYKLGLNKGVQR